MDSEPWWFHCLKLWYGSAVQNDKNYHISIIFLTWIFFYMTVALNIIILVFNNFLIYNNIDNLVSTVSLLSCEHLIYSLPWWWKWWWHPVKTSHSREICFYLQIAEFCAIIYGFNTWYDYLLWLNRKLCKLCYRTVMIGRIRVMRSQTTIETARTQKDQINVSQRNMTLETWQWHDNNNMFST